MDEKDVLETEYTRGFKWTYLTCYDFNLENKLLKLHIANILNKCFLYNNKYPHHIYFLNKNGMTNAIV